jgi:hypothetical protein
LDPHQQEKFDKLSSLDKGAFLERLGERQKIADDAVGAAVAVIKRAVQEDRFEDWEYPSIEQAVGRLSAEVVLGVFGTPTPASVGTIS